MGLDVRRYKVDGVERVVQVSRKEIKIVFKDKLTANAFLKSDVLVWMGVKAIIPKYNLEKVGVVFDIPAKFDEKFLLECLESSLPIVSVYRCQKRKIVI